MKKQRFFMLGIITVLVAVLSLTFVSSTFAKYTSTVTGNDSARVAKWELKVDDSVVIGQTPAALAFNLFDAAKVRELDNEENVLDTDDAEVKDGTGDDVIIAPGTGGTFTFVIKNTSEVAAHVTASYAVTNTANIPVEFSLTNEYGSWTTIDGINAAIAAGQDLAVGDTTGYTITLYWRWAFSVNDTNDTQLGYKGTDTIKVDVTVNATQIK